MLDLRSVFLCLCLFASALAVDVRYNDLISNINSYYSYMSVPVTFSIKLDEIPLGKLKFPDKYSQGYNELDLLGANLLPIKKIPFYLEIKVLVPVAKDQLAKGKILLDKDIIRNWKPIDMVNQQTILNLKEIIGKENVYYKKNGDAFYLSDIKEPDIIKIQGECRINVKSGSVRVSMPGVSLKNGSLGSTIKVLNKETGKILDARVVDSKNVEVVIN